MDENISLLDRLNGRLMRNNIIAIAQEVLRRARAISKARKAEDEWIKSLQQRRLPAERAE